jgi:hypothetical protein
MSNPEINFLYDQVLELFVRLNSFCVATPHEQKNEKGGNIDYEIYLMSEALFKRDMLVFAASLRNFAEATKTTKAMKGHIVLLSEIYWSGGFPYNRDSNAKGADAINIYQTVSRILHASSLDILSDKLSICTKIFSFNDALHHAHEVNDKRVFSPLICVQTDKEPQTLFLLSRFLNASRIYIDSIIDHLGDQKIYIERSLRE